MDQRLKDMVTGRKFLCRTLGKLFEPSNAPLLSLLSLLGQDQIAEVASRIEIMKMKEGTALPTLKKGMFMLLRGNLEIKTHWKLETGLDDPQKFYLDYIEK